MYKTTLPRRIRIRAAAEHYGVCRDTIRRRIADGSLTGYRNGRIILVDVEELDALFRQIPTGLGA